MAEQKCTEATLEKYHNNKTRNLYDRIQYFKILEDIKHEQSDTTSVYRLKKKYDILEVAGCERLIAKVEKNDGEAVQV